MNKDASLMPAKFICDPDILHNPVGKYSDEMRKFQGIPGLECTKNGRFFSVFYTGEDGERAGNFLLLQKSDDGVNFGKAFMVVEAPCDEVRCYDPCLWISPDGKLRLFYAQSYGYFDGRCGVWETVCDDPDADEIVFGEPRRIANGIMMNKPTVRSDGAWLLPCAVWAVSNSELNWLPDERFSNVYISEDSGKSYRLHGSADYPNRFFDEHRVIENSDGTLAMYIRGKSDIGRAISTDGGKTWSEGEDTGLGNPNSRFCIRRLNSGRLLLVNHVNFGGLDKLYKERSNLTAFLSEDDGKTWQGGLLLDERSGVSYPDAVEAPDGFIHLIYDYNRYTDREILLARFTEADILAGAPVTDGTNLKRVINKAYGGMKNA